MRDDRFSGSFILVVRQIELLCGFFYDFRDFGIMHMTDVRKYVVFYLMVKATGEPVHNFVFRAKINSGEQLMYGPSIFHGTIFVR